MSYELAVRKHIGHENHIACLRDTAKPRFKHEKFKLGLVLFGPINFLDFQLLEQKTRFAVFVNSKLGIYRLKTISKSLKKQIFIP